MVANNKGLAIHINPLELCKKARHGNIRLESQSCDGRGRWAHGIHRLASLVFLGSSKLMSNLVSKHKVDVPEQHPKLTWPL